MRVRSGFRRLPTLGAILAVAACACPAPRAAMAAPGATFLPGAAALGERWGQEVWRLEPGETFQFRVEFAQIPVRVWRLVVEGGQLQSDLVVRREADGSLLYAKRNESRHDVTVPWGRDEALAVALAPGRVGGGLYTVTFYGPPRDDAPESYSYRVNRALEAFAAGDRPGARRLAEAARAEDPNDGAALVLLAGFLRDEGEPARAAGLLDRALATDLPPRMLALARGLRDGFAAPDAALPDDVAARLAAADSALARGSAAAALAACDSLLAAQPAAGAAAHAATLRRRGQALQGLGRRFEAVDALSLALALAPSRPEQARLHYHLGLLQRELGNAAQARAALALARRQGLPADLDAAAAAALAELGGPDGE